MTTALGLRHSERIIGIHLNFIPGSYRPYLPPGTAPTASEELFQRLACWLAAWIVEKFRDWSDCDREIYCSLTRDELLRNITLYWMIETISSSVRLYHEVRRAPLHFSAGDFVHVPCGIAHFPKEIVFPPREWVERNYNIQDWSTM